MSRSLYAKLYRRFARRLSGAERAQAARQRVNDLLALLPPTPASPGSAFARASVIVVGAGLAGLSAAWWLNRFGVGSVTVLEARNRVGGRVRSLTNFAPGRIVEGGAEWVGLNHPLWLYFARGFGLSLSTLSPEDDSGCLGLEMPIHVNGTPLTGDQAFALFQEMTSALEEIARDAANVSALAPWDHPAARILDSISVADRLQRLALSDLARQALRAHFETERATALDRQSYLGLLALVKGGGLMQFWSESEVFRCQRGNQQLAERLMQSVQGKAANKVLLGHPVTRVQIREGETAGTPVTVTAGGARFTGDYVVLAVPPPIWSQMEISPALPPDLNPGLGPAVKYISQVPSRFWMLHGLSPSGFSDRLGTVWEGTDQQMEIKGQSLTLSSFTGGPAAEAALDAEDARRYFAVHLEALYPGYTRRVSESRFVAWPRDPWTGTGYSCPPPLGVTTVSLALNSLHGGRLLFAGEHVSTAFFGYMEGALQSGLHAALRILKNEGVPVGFPDVVSM